MPGKKWKQILAKAPVMFFFKFFVPSKGDCGTTRWIDVPESDEGDRGIASHMVASALHSDLEGTTSKWKGAQTLHPLTPWLLV
jgi:hypothetical protein